MTDRPILFSGPMVRRLLADTKTQTRREVTPARSIIGSLPAKDWPLLDFDAPGVRVDGGGEANIFQPIANAQYLHVPHRDGDTVHRVYSRVQPGDVLWVRETWRTTIDFDYLMPREVPFGSPIRYEVDDAVSKSAGPRAWGRVRQSIYTLRWMARISRRVVSVRCERVQSITDADARAEGVRELPMWFTGDESKPHLQRGSAVEAYRALWIEINGRASWDANPHVWIYDFRKGGTP